jgi:hypothetical protein
VEAHGTGTALGDPTEAGALSAVHGARSVSLAICAVKASVGHAEAASGQVGLLRVWRLLVEAAASGNAQLRALNPLVRERLGRASSPFMLPAQEAAVCGPAGGISSFGFSGTIAHAVLRLVEAGLSSHAAPVVHLRHAFPWREASAWYRRGIGEALARHRTGHLPLVYHRHTFLPVQHRHTSEFATFASYTIAWPRKDCSIVPAGLQPLLLATHSYASLSALKPPIPREADLCIIGGGTIGIIIARDAASCGHKSIVLEKESVIGGVWMKNDYPGLRLQNAGAAYRCLSLAPAWARDGEGRADVLYRPTGKEVLSYLHDMAAHELIDVVQ